MKRSLRHFTQGMILFCHTFRFKLVLDRCFFKMFIIHEGNIWSACPGLLAELFLYLCQLVLNKLNWEGSYMTNQINSINAGILIVSLTNAFIIIVHMEVGDYLH